MDGGATASARRVAMAKIRRNVILGEVSGQIGDNIVLKRARGGQTILCRKPTFPKHRVFSPAQQEHQKRFREASAYAKQVAARQPIYAEKAKKTGQPAYNVALADFMHPPEIPGIDLSGYTGKVGKVIRVQARDDVAVTRVSVVIADANKQIVEQGPATCDASGSWWTYTATEDCPSMKVTIAAYAEDLTGHGAEREEEKG